MFYFFYLQIYVFIIYRMTNVLLSQFYEERLPNFET